MLGSLLNALFGCGHARTTFPITPRRTSATTKSDWASMYVVCLDCGQKLRYNWDEMCIAGPMNRHSAPPTPNPLRWITRVSSGRRKKELETRCSDPRPV